PAVSGDGRRVAFIETDGRGQGSIERLSVTDFAQPPRVSTVVTGLLGARPSWGADGRTLGVRVTATTAAAAGGLPVEIAVDAAPPGERLGRTWLAYGVTTVREVAADLAEAVERGESWASGRPLGPRLVVSPADGAPAPAPGLSASTVVPVRAYPGIADGFGHAFARLARELPAGTLDVRLARAEPRDVGSGAHYE